MPTINHLPPARMTPDLRRAEVASLLAAGLVRLRAANADKHEILGPENEFLLGFSGHQSVHADTVNPTKVESK